MGRLFLARDIEMARTALREVKNTPKNKEFGTRGKNKEFRK